MTGDMTITLMLIVVGMLLIGFALYRTRFRQLRVAERIQSITDQLED